MRIVCEITGVEPKRAEALLKESGWRVKPAIIMATLGMPLEEAEHRLEAADGVLARVIGPAGERAQRGTP